MGSEPKFHFFIPGVARTSGSKKFMGYAGDGKPIMAPAGEYQKPWSDAIGWTFMEKFGRPVMLTGPVEFEAIFYMTRPDAHYRRKNGLLTNEIKPTAPKWCTTNPDCDKMRRLAQDALSGLAYKDDKQIVIGRDSKPYVVPGQPPGAEILIFEIEGE